MSSAAASPHGAPGWPGLSPGPLLLPLLLGSLLAAVVVAARRLVLRARRAAAAPSAGAAQAAAERGRLLAPGGAAERPGEGAGGQGGGRPGGGEDASLTARVPLHPAELQAPATTVCVTGATGYLAGVLTARLLAAGHTVRGTVRALDPAHPAQAALLALPGAEERLSLHEADLMAPGSFDPALRGCTAVFHTASPFDMAKDAEDLVGPAVRGVENVLGSCSRTPSVNRVVLTSSIAATCSSAGEHGAGKKVDEGCWNSTASPAFLPYHYSKTQAERRAWELAEQQDRQACPSEAGWRLVVLLPGLVLGPCVGAGRGRASAESVRLLRRLLSGIMYPFAPNMGVAHVDIRDVAAGHCLAAFTPGASGRYLLVAGGARMRRMTAVLARLYPGGSVRAAVLPVRRWVVWLLAPYMRLRRDVVVASWGAPPVYHTARAEGELGVGAKGWLPLEVSLYDMVEDLAAKKLVRHPMGPQRPSSASPE
ncbi:hypothetical protein HYH03_012140 [Edaphochlamys debaryana]|uniref:NAD-dependent epimerase/dehydratase domain-containing protein n=1 Tax=Edaphochlamys debaryana TaxID=47281 RepID=A0A835XUM0_9CHLO|nr:hypothetical protein HYH03_012140 [Edaphochlamys debaryana]|eukprot:KAG2489308.1 hypothetical protein HYH03_012140 [Edaphochlamys debaryana]